MIIFFFARLSFCKNDIKNVKVDVWVSFVLLSWGQAAVHESSGRLRRFSRYPTPFTRCWCFAPSGEQHTTLRVSPGPAHLGEVASPGAAPVCLFVTHNGAAGRGEPFVER